jgi:hypothetical protein
MALIYWIVVVVLNMTSVGFDIPPLTKKKLLICGDINTDYLIESS